VQVAKGRFNERARRGIKGHRDVAVLPGMRCLTVVTTALAATLAASSAFANVTLGPAAQPQGPGRVTVIWCEATDHDPITVTLTSPGHPDATAESRVTGDIHAAEFRGLVPGVEYRYTIGDREGRFIAPPDASQNVRFAVFGDSRSGDAAHRQIIDRVVAQRPDLAFEPPSRRHAMPICRRATRGFVRQSLAQVA
jgi:hypothetical protein